MIELIEAHHDLRLALITLCALRVLSIVTISLTAAHAVGGCEVLGSWARVGRRVLRLLSYLLCLVLSLVVRWEPGLIDSHGGLRDDEARVVERVTVEIDSGWLDEHTVSVLVLLVAHLHDALLRRKLSRPQHAFTRVACCAVFCPSGRIRLALLVHWSHLVRMVAVFLPLGAQCRRALPLPFDKKPGLVLYLVDLPTSCSLIHHISHTQVARLPVLLCSWRILLEGWHGPQINDVLFTLRDSLLLATIKLGFFDAATHFIGQVLTL